MAYTKQYSKTTWVNNEAPAINATNLNKIEEGIDNVDTELVSQDSRISNLEANEVDATGIDAGYVPTADGQDGWDWAAQSGGGLTDGIKQALLQIAQKVAYIDANGQDYYDDLYDALYAVTAVNVSPTTLNFSTLGSTQQLTATTTPSGATVTWASSNTAVATVDANGLVTSVGYGSATITATAGQLSATCAVVVAQATVTSIDAVYTQSGTVYDTDTLDSLKSDLVVTAHWSNGTTSTVASADYTLSGTLATGTSTVTVSYGGKTDTFSVTVTAHVIDAWYYPFDNSILSAGTHDFGFSGVQEYAQGVNGQCYYHHVATEGDSSTDPLGLYALQSSDAPTWGSNDFTISGWQKCVEPNRGHLFNAANYIGATAVTWDEVSMTLVDSNWFVEKQGITKKYAGIRLGMYATSAGTITGSVPQISFINSALSKGCKFQIQPPNDFDTTQWHHYAFTRSGDVLYYFVDGTLIFTATLPSGAELYSSNYITVGNFIAENTNNSVAPYAYSAYYDDLYVNVGTAKWTSDFDPYSIVY